MRSKLHPNLSIFVSALLIIIILSIFSLTNPRNIPAVSLVIPIIFIFVFLLLVTNEFSKAILLIIARNSESNLSVPARIPIIISSVLTAILILNTIERISLLEAIVVIMVGIILSFYIHRTGLLERK